MVAERLGVFESLARSRALTRGSRWKLFGLALVMLLALFGGSAVLVPLARAAGDIGVIVQALNNLLFVLLYVPLVAAAFVEARRVREGAPTDRLAEVFA